MSRSPLTHTARSLVTRRLHTPGRQTPNPGQGGSPSLTTISPNSTHPATHQTPPPIPGTSARSSIDIANADPTLHNSLASTSTSSIKQHERKFTPKGKLIPHRPARTIPVNLPSGFPEPPTYPPPPEYFTDLEAKKKDPHPLWQFFHVTPEAKERLKIDAPRPVRAGALDVMGEGEGELSSLSGRAWTAAELRQKSFTDLHTLWYVLLKERNLQATQREERRRLKINAQEGGELLVKASFRCRKSMARIKYVLNERRLGLIAAANPLLERPVPKIPFSSSTRDDPMAAVEALKGLSVGEADASLEALDADETESVVGEGEVAKQEVESRDEGFGGGKEAEEFVRDVKVDERHVEKQS